MNYFSHESPPCFDWLDNTNIYSIRYTKFILTIKNKRPETKRKKGMHLHHIRPKHYYESESLEIDNSENNLVSLTPREHAIVHILLYKATKNYKDRWAVCYVLRDKNLESNTRFLKNYVANPVISDKTKDKMKQAWETRRKENRASPWNKGVKGSEAHSDAAKKAWETRRKNKRDKMSPEQKAKISASVSKTKKNSPKTRDAALKAWKTRRKSKQDDIVETA